MRDSILAEIIQNNPIASAVKRKCRERHDDQVTTLKLIAIALRSQLEEQISKNVEMALQMPPEFFEKIKQNADGQSDPRWVILYDNGTGPSDEGYYEWWSVTDGERLYRCNSEADAAFLCETLNRKVTT